MDTRIQAYRIVNLDEDTGSLWEHEPAHIAAMQEHLRSLRPRVQPGELGRVRGIAPYPDHPALTLVMAYFDDAPVLEAVNCAVTVLAFLADLRQFATERPKDAALLYTRHSLDEVYQALTCWRNFWLLPELSILPYPRSPTERLDRQRHDLLLWSY